MKNLSSTRTAHQGMATYELSREDEQDLSAEAKNWFSKLSETPDGEVLSKKGAVEAYLALARHYARELALYEASPPSSKVTEELSNAAEQAAEAADSFHRANKALEILQLKLASISPEAILRLKATAGPRLQLMDDVLNVFSEPFSKTMTRLEEATLDQEEEDFLKSEILFHISQNAHKEILNSCSDTHKYVNQYSDKNIDKLVLANSIFKQASTLQCVVNTKGGPQNSYTEFKLSPHFQLAEGCRAIISASKLRAGNTKNGLQIEMADYIRNLISAKKQNSSTNIHKNDFTSNRRAHEDLPSKVIGEPLPKGQIPLYQLRVRIRYWALGLLIQDLGRSETFDEATRAKFEQLKKQREAHYRALEERQLLLPQDGNEMTFQMERGPARGIDAFDPFL